MFIALIPLLFVLWKTEGKRARWKGVGLGWLAGFAFFAINLKWLNTVTWQGALILPVYLALYWAAFGAFAATWGNPFRSGETLTVRRVTFTACSNAFVWAGLEWLRGWLLTGFGWNGLGVGLHDKLLFAQAADLFGVCGLSAALVFIQAVISPMLLAQTQLRVRIRLWSVAALFLLSLAGYGFARTTKLDLVEKRQSVGKPSWPKSGLHDIPDPVTLSRLLRRQLLHLEMQVGGHLPRAYGRMRHGIYHNQSTNRNERKSHLSVRNIRGMLAAEVRKARDAQEKNEQEYARRTRFSSIRRVVRKRELSIHAGRGPGLLTPVPVRRECAERGPARSPSIDRWYTTSS